MRPIYSVYARAGRFGLLALLILAFPLGGAAQTTDKREPTLRERLNAGLQARRPSEIAFLDAVAETVGRGELSEDLVNRVFFWARTRPNDRRASRRPIIYFQPALQRIAKRGRVVIQTDLEAIQSAG